MPFQDNLTTIYETVFKPVVKSKGLECRRADDYQTNKEIMKDIWNAICQSQVVIAEMTGFNPNVIYHGKKKALSIFNGSCSLLLNGLIFAT
jgi:hypothetical protein